MSIEQRAIFTRELENRGISERATAERAIGNDHSLVAQAKSAQETLRLEKFKMTLQGTTNIFEFNQPVDMEGAIKFLFRVQFDSHTPPKDTKSKEYVFYKMIIDLWKNEHIKHDVGTRTLKIEADIEKLRPYLRTEIESEVRKQLPPLTYTPADEKTQAEPKSQLAQHSPDSGTTLFLYYPAESGKDRYQSKPKEGPYQRTEQFKDLSDLVNLAKGFAEAEGLISRLGILAHHGGKSGSSRLGSTYIDWENIDDYQDTIRSLAEALTKDAFVLFLGCDAGGGAQGSLFLKKWSDWLQGRKVVGFGALTTTVPAAAQGGGIIPLTRTTAQKTDGGEEYAELMIAKHKIADENNPIAKIAQDGQIKRWPANEKAKAADIEAEEWRLRQNLKKK
jgi:hypothetical protein